MPAPRSQKAIFFDRDGVLVKSLMREGKPYAARTLSEFEIVPAFQESMEKLRRAGFLLIVTTNQPDITTGKNSWETIDEMHRRMDLIFRLDGYEVCPHTDLDQCDCRKPKPGLLTRAAQRENVDLARSWMVGDRWRDIDAGRAAGCRTIWIETEYKEKKPAGYDAKVKDLAEAAEYILGTTTS